MTSSPQKRRPRQGTVRFCVLFVLIMGNVLPVQAAEPTQSRLSAKQAAFFKTYCIRCHGPKQQNGKVRLDTISFDIAKDLQTADTWQKILNALNSAAMPPDGEKHPSNREKAAFLEELSEKMVVARKKLSDSGGQAVMRRLNRREYRNTIRDLLGVTIDVSHLPSDKGSGGFDTVGSSLFFSPAQFERYLKLGRKALEEVIVRPGQQPPKSHTTRTQVEQEAKRTAEAYIKKFRDVYRRHKAWAAAKGKRPATDFGFLDAPRARRGKKLYLKNAPYYFAYKKWPRIDQGTYFSRLHSTLAAGFSEQHPPGEYVVRICVGATKNAPANRRFIEFGKVVDVGGRTDFEVVSSHHVTAGIDRPQVIELPVTLRKTHGSQRGGLYTFREMRPDHKMANWKKNPVVPDPVLWVDWVEIEGPKIPQWPPANHRRIFFGGPGTAKNANYARKIIARFAERAFRGKKPAAEYLNRLLAIYKQHKQAGATFEEAVKEALAVVLASPSFLYLAEPTPPEANAEAKHRKLTDLELASRLSYFLWSAPPDETLLSAAQNGSLRNPEKLRAQVDRMLKDPKSREFVTGFTHQWLDLDRIDLFQFDRELYPDFEESTKLAAVDEVYHFFETLLRENLSARNLLSSDFVVVNGLMAEYYGIDGVTGDAWQKRPAPPHRGGLLGMAAMLAMGSDGERTSPVERGAFVLRKLLGAPPPPAPANVPQLSRLDDKPLTVRQRLRIHQEKAQCLHCHRKIDPIGFGLENFNAAGKWRSEEVLYQVSFNKRGKRKKKEVGTRPIDASGKLHNGPSFKNYEQLRNVIAGRTDEFSRGLIEALLEYALGRQISFSDEELIARIQKEMKRDDYRLRTLIHLITQSRAFRTK